MGSKIGNFFDSVGSFFSGGDKIPWCERDVIVVSFLFPLFSPFSDCDFGLYENWFDSSIMARP